MRPEEEKSFTGLKLQQVARLRKRVTQEVAALQKAALEALSGGEAAKKHAEAGQVMSLYPMSEDKPVLEEAKLLAAQQAEVAGRMKSYAASVITAGRRNKSRRQSTTTTRIPATSTRSPRTRNSLRLRHPTSARSTRP